MDNKHDIKINDTYKQYILEQIKSVLKNPLTSKKEYLLLIKIKKELEKL